MTNKTDTEPTNNLVIRLQEQEKLLTESYLRGLTDFVKWTSTVAAGAILWIANSITSVPTQCRLPAVIALSLLALSLVTALLIGRLVLVTWKTKWDATDATHSFVRLQSALQSQPFPPSLDPETLQSQGTARNEALEQLLQKSRDHSRRLQSAASRNLLDFHLFFLLAGVITYTGTQLFYAFTGTPAPFTSPISP